MAVWWRAGRVKPQARAFTAPGAYLPPAFLRGAGLWKSMMAAKRRVAKSIEKELT